MYISNKDYEINYGESMIANEMTGDDLKGVYTNNLRGLVLNGKNLHTHFNILTFN
jgi:hypothetical protein